MERPSGRLRMPCYQGSTNNGAVSSSPGYATEAECLAACKEGACCEGTTCSVKPQCQCQGTGQTFKGVGTVCSGTSGYCCGPATWSATDISNGQDTKTFSSSQTFLQCRSGFSQAGPAVTTQSGCDAIGGQWITSPCVSCWEVIEKTGFGGSFKLVCYPSTNPLP